MTATDIQKTLEGMEELRSWRLNNVSKEVNAWGRLPKQIVSQHQVLHFNVERGE